ncbi:protein of unknown function (4846) [Lishizhenia tianjinensis]|uniref:DUF4846 domain-containing protein n=2 Tax=Lishizhenia tianjinensis TaxID=477690 RepID=A0A1I6XFK0_9FLAO|nr:protein of unknown function (4846) [Lishizhenia tianjinensis]
MYFQLLTSFLVLQSLFSCTVETVNHNTFSEIKSSPGKKAKSLKDTTSFTLAGRFNTPLHAIRTEVDSSSFGTYLRNLPLKKEGAQVKYYDGDFKYNASVYCAVVDLPIGQKDLHQCADAVMRFRAEYLWEQKRYDEIHFNFTNGFRVDYTQWMKGKRIRVSGNKVEWVQRAQASNTYHDFWEYMECIFTYAGTLSLSRELNPIPLNEMQIGDVIIKGGSPGHAVLVVDMAQDTLTQKHYFMLAQSYMPAQETQILVNPNIPGANPWYCLEDIEDKIYTPEWTFARESLMRF